MKKRVICILLSLCLLLGTAPALYANAADNSERTIIAFGDFDVPEAEDTKETTESETKNQEQTVESEDEILENESDNAYVTDSVEEVVEAESAIAALSAVIDSGSCGTNATWELHDNYTLYISGSGAMSNYTGSGAMPWAQYKSLITDIVISSGITSIGNYAFYTFSALESIIIPNNIVTIGDSAFNSSWNLKAISIGNSVTSIGSRAFANCSLSAIYIPSNVTTISSYAFSSNVNCTEITIMNSSASIGTMAFYKSPYTTIYGNKGSTAETYAKNNYLNFEPLKTAEGHTGLKWTVYTDDIINPYNPPDAILEITGEGAFPDIPGFSEVPWYNYAGTITDVIIGEGVTALASPLFYFSGLSSYNLKITVLNPNLPINFPTGNSATYYGYAGSTLETYANNNNLTFVPISVTASGTSGGVNWKLYSTGLLELDGYGATANFTSLASVPWYNYRTSIKRVKIGENVRFVSNYAFYNTTSLINVFITNPGTSFGVDVFTGSRASAKIYGYDNAKEIASLYSKSYLKLYNFNGYMYRYNDPSYSTIKTWTLYTNGLLEVDGKGSFNSFSTSSPAPWTDYTASITKVSIDEKITSIGSNFITSFNGPIEMYNPNLDYFNDSFGSNYSGTIYGYENCTTEYYADDYGMSYDYFEKAGVVNDVTWRLDSNGLLKISGSGAIKNFSATGAPWYQYRTAIKNVVVDSGVTRIGNYSFSGCLNLVSVMIANTSLTFGSNIFNNTNATFTIIAYENSTAHTYATNNSYNYDYYIIDSGRCGDNAKWAFHENGKLTINGTGSMYDYTLAKDLPWQKYRSQITSIDIQEGITKVGNYAFYNFSATSLSLPNSLTTVGSYSFAECYQLGSVTIPNGVRTIQDYAFSYTCITELSLGNSLQSIGKAAFEYSELTSVYIPESVIVLSNYCFSGSTSLVNITIPANNLMQIGTNVFENNTGTTIYSRTGTLAHTYAINNGINFVAIS